MLVSKNYQYNQCTIPMLSEKYTKKKSMLHGSSLMTDRLTAAVASPASRLDGGQFPLVSPIPCHIGRHRSHRSQPSCHMLRPYRCTTDAGPAGLQSQTSQRSCSIDSKRSRSTHGRPNSQTNVLKNTPTITVVQSIINSNN